MSLFKKHGEDFYDYIQTIRKDSLGQSLSKKAESLQKVNELLAQRLNELLTKLANDAIEIIETYAKAEANNAIICEFEKSDSMIDIYALNLKTLKAEISKLTLNQLVDSSSKMIIIRYNGFDFVKSELSEFYTFAKVIEFLQKTEHLKKFKFQIGHKPTSKSLSTTTIIVDLS